MPDVSDPRPRSRGPANGHLWSGQAAPEAPAPPQPEPAPSDTTEPTLFGAGAESAKTTEAPAAEPVLPRRGGASGPPPRGRDRTRGGRSGGRGDRGIWPRALAGGAASGLAVAAAALAIGGTFDGNNTSGSAAQSPAIVTSTGAKGSNTNVGAIYAAASPAVAAIQTQQGSGTGFLIHSNGTLVSNAHVVGDSTTVRVKFGNNGDVLTARVIGKDTGSDLAVLKVDPAKVSSIHPLALANSDNVKVGDLAVAIGNPLGLDQTATAGIISGLGREIQAPDGFSIDKVIQTDAPINPGNSGGPLLNSKGEVVGINSQIATSGGGSGSIGIGFAVPSNTVKEVVPQLEQGRSIKRPWLGVSTSPSLQGNGAQVQQVVGGSPAESAGVQAGDVITSVDGKSVHKPDDVASAVTPHKPGDTVKVTVERAGGGGSTSLNVRLGDRPANTGGG